MLSPGWLLQCRTPSVLLEQSQQLTGALQHHCLHSVHPAGADSLHLRVANVLHLLVHCVNVKPALMPSCALCSLMRARSTCLRSEQQDLAVT